MRRLTASLTAVAFLAMLLAATARAETVDVAIVLAADVSRSIDGDEFNLQHQGYAAAISSPQVLRAIRSGVHGTIALCYFEWAGPDEQKVVVPWMVIRDDEAAAVFAATLLDAPRSFYGRTGIGAAIDYGVGLLGESGLAAERRVIDVSGDGTSNSGRLVTAARDEAVAQGLTINGLAIHNPRANAYFFAHTNPPGGLPNYYRENVIGGPSAFLLPVEGFDTFTEAMTQKLLSEIAASPPRERLAQQP